MASQRSRSALARDFGDLPIESLKDVRKAIAEGLTGQLGSEVRILLACMPKSGSTMLATILESMPGMDTAKLVPAYKRREQELCINAIERIQIRSAGRLRRWRNELADEGTHEQAPQGYVAQHHVRYSTPTEKILTNYNLKPVVLVRNIFDIVPSVRDHYRNASTDMSMAYVGEEMTNWSDDQLHNFIADMVVPWYFNFYRSWLDRSDKLLVTYEALVRDTPEIVAEVLDYCGVSYREEDVDRAIAASAQKDTRKNKGVTGRGDQLSDKVRAKIAAYADYYPDVDFRPIGL